jgi:hypothetical protein
MSWTLIDSQVASGGGGSTTITRQVTNVAAGDLIMVAVAHDSGAVTIDSVSDGTNTLTLRSTLSSGSIRMAQAWQVQPASPTGTVTFTATFGASALARNIHVRVLRPTGTPSLDAALETAAQISTTAVNSGNITTTGTDGVAMCTTYFETAGAVTTPLINGGAGTDLQSTGVEMSSWYATYAAGFTGEGAATGPNTSRHTTTIIAFTIAAGDVTVGLSGSAGTGGHGTSVPDFQIPL